MLLERQVADKSARWYLSSMNRLATVAENVKTLAQERLGKGVVVEDIRVSDYVDEAGENAYQILIVVNQFNPEILTSDKRSALTVALVRKLGAEGDARFPFISFVPHDELAELSAND
jgi:hypothetical protein